MFQYTQGRFRDLRKGVQIRCKSRRKRDIQRPDIQLMLRQNKPMRYAAMFKQEAQLSQRDSAMLRVTEYFAKSLKVTRGHS